MINKVLLIGNLGGDPELKTFDSGKEVARFSLATSESYKGKDGEWQEKTEWHTVVAWNELADRAMSTLAKGTTIWLEGKISYRTYEDQHGNKKYFTEIVATYFRFIRKAGEHSNEAQAQPQQRQPAAQQRQPAAQPHYEGTIPGPIGGGKAADDDDLPF